MTHATFQDYIHDTKEIKNLTWPKYLSGLQQQ